MRTEMPSAAKTTVPSSLLDEWIAQMAMGDMNALERLYDTTSDGIFGFALTLVKNRQDAEDVLHDCYTAVFASAAGYHSQGKPMAWLLTVARNLCLQKLREQGKTAEDLPPEREDPTALPAQQTEDKLLLEECMGCLSEEEQQILILHAVSGMKHREIADVLALSLSTVLSKYHRGIKKLKVFLERRDTHEK